MISLRWLRTVGGNAASKLTVSPKGPNVLGAGLKCSESTGVERSPGSQKRPGPHAASPGSGAARRRAGARGGGRSGTARRAIEGRVTAHRSCDGRDARDAFAI
jgi:hypothetical protein